MADVEVEVSSSGNALNLFVSVQPGRDAGVRPRTDWRDYVTFLN